MPVTVTVPVAVAVNVTEQVPAANVQLAGLNEPAAPVDVNDTVPVGTLVIPADVSATVAVHVEATPTTTGEVHEIVVEVVLGLTVMLPVPELPEWVPLPPYVPVTITVPVAVAVNVTEHVPAASVQLAALNEPAAPVEVNATVPVGTLEIPAEVSATVAVQVDATPTTTGLVQDIVVEVVRGLTVIDPVPELVA